MRYKLAIFDMDGTILNTLEDLTDSTNYALRANGMPERTIEEVRGFVGNGIRKLIERAVGEGSDNETTDMVFDCFKEYYRTHCAIKTRPYDGIIDTINALKNKGVMTAVVSNKADFAVQSLCEDYFEGLFDYAVGDKEGQRRKPYPDAVYEVLDRLKVDKADAVYIGDSEVDYMTAKNSGLDVIMVGWGFRDEEFLIAKGAPFVIYDTEDILKLILGERQAGDYILPNLTDGK